MKVARRGRGVAFVWLLLAFSARSFAGAAAGGRAPYDLDVASHATPSRIDSGSVVEVPLSLRNAGSRAWEQAAFHVSYHWFASDGATIAWDGERTLLPRAVAPGEEVRLTAKLAAPKRSGSLRLQWDVVEESVTWISQRDPSPPPLIDVEIVAGAVAQAFTIVSRDTVRVMTAESARHVRMTLRNDGTETWRTVDPIYISYHWTSRDERKSVFDGARTALPGTTARGSVAEADVDLVAPRAAGIYRLQWDMVHEHRLWFADVDPTPEAPFVVIVLPAVPPLEFAFFFALGWLVLSALAYWRIATSRVVLALASVGDLLAMFVAIVVKQSAVPDTAHVGYSDGGLGAVVASAAAITILVATLPSRLRAWLTVAVNALVSLIVLADVLHLRFFHDVLSLVRFRSAGQLTHLVPTIASLLTSRDVWLFVDLVPVVMAAILLRDMAAGSSADRHPERPEGGRISRFFASPEMTTARSGRTPSLVLALVLTPLLIPGVMKLWRVHSSAEGNFVQVFRNLFIVQELGVLNYHAYDAAARLDAIAFRKSVSGARLAELESFFRATAPQRAGAGPAFGAARDRNLVMIQVESMQNFVLGLRIDGQEVTPNLNRWLASEALWFSRCTDQTAQGRSSDGELTSQVSLHPLRQGAAAFRFGDNRYDGLARILASHGYATLSAVPFEPSFWNRLVTLPAYGYDRNLFETDFAPGPTVGWGLNDRDFLRQMPPHLAALRKPFAAYLITLSDHYPFDSFPDSLKTLRLPSYEGTPLANYLHAMHLFDTAFGDFLEGMSKAGLLDSTAIVVWGDHAAGLEWSETLARLAGREFTEPDFYFVDEVPLIVRVPGAKLTGENRIRCGLVDAPPTLLALLGIDPAAYPFVGRNLLGNPGGGPVVRGYGAWFDGPLMYLPHGARLEDGACYESESRKLVDVERCRAGSIRAREQLEVSADVVKHDLQTVLTERLGKR